MHLLLSWMNAIFSSVYRHVCGHMWRRRDGCYLDVGFPFLSAPERRLLNSHLWYNHVFQFEAFFSFSTAVDRVGTDVMKWELLHRMSETRELSHWMFLCVLNTHESTELDDLSMFKPPSRTSATALMTVDGYLIIDKSISTSVYLSATRYVS